MWLDLHGDFRACVKSVHAEEMRNEEDWGNTAARVGDGTQKYLLKYAKTHVSMCMYTGVCVHVLGVDRAGYQGISNRAALAVM